MSWVRSANGHSDFPLQNLPFGVFSRSTAASSDRPRGGIRIGEQILDLRALVETGLLTGAGAHRPPELRAGPAP